MKIAIVLGTRPEIIKMSPVIRALGSLRGVGGSRLLTPDSRLLTPDSRLLTPDSRLETFILHTGQHYSYNLDRVFFEQLKLPQPKYNLEVGSGSHAEQTARILIGAEKVLLQENPDIVLVEGDTNSVLAAALAAAKLHIKVGHIEAGLRSYDRNMPEEINRLLTDHCSDYLFAPTEKAKQILLGEGIPEDRIFVTGNTIVDAVYQNLKIARKNSSNFKIKPINSGLKTINSELPTPDSRLQTPDSRLQTPDSRLPTPDSRLPTPDSRLPTPDSRLRTTFW